MTKLCCPNRLPCPTKEPPSAEASWTHTSHHSVTQNMCTVLYITVHEEASAGVGSFARQGGLFGQ